MKTGELDADFRASVLEGQALRNDPGVTVRVTPFPSVGALVFNNADPIMRERKLRLAIAYAINRARFWRAEVSLGFYDASTAAKEQFGWAYDPSAAQPAYDPARADALLDQLGWKQSKDGLRMRGGKPLQIVLASKTEGLDPNVDVIVQAQLRLVGIDVVVKTYTDSMFFSSGKQGVYRGGNFQLMYLPLYYMAYDGDLSSELD